MSYILDALRKADRERNLGQTPNIDAVVEPAAAPTQKRNWLWPIVAVNTLALLIILWLVMDSRESPDDATAVNRDANAEQPAAPSPANIAPDASASAVSEPVVDAEKNEAVTESDEDSAEDIIDPPPAIETAEQAVNRTEKPRPSVVQQQAPNTLEPTTEITTPPPAPVEQAASEQPANTYSSLPELRDLPLDVQRQLPVLEMNAHFYTSEPTRRFAVINLNRYRQGEQLDEGPDLEAITREGIVLNWRGERFILKR